MTMLIITVVAVWLAQRLMAMHQAMRFRRQYSALRRDGRLVSMGAAKRFGRRVYVALAADPDGTVVENLVFHGVTVFASGKRDDRLTGTRVARLAAGSAPESVEPMVAEAAAQAAGFLLDAGTRTEKKAAERRTADKRRTPGVSVAR